MVSTVATANWVENGRGGRIAISPRFHCELITWVAPQATTVRKRKGSGARLESLRAGDEGVKKERAAPAGGQLRAGTASHVEHGRYIYGKVTGAFPAETTSNDSLLQGRDVVATNVTAGICSG